MKQDPEDKLAKVSLALIKKVESQLKQVARSILQDAWPEEKENELIESMVKFVRLSHKPVPLVKGEPCYTCWWTPRQLAPIWLRRALGKTPFEERCPWVMESLPNKFHKNPEFDPRAFVQDLPVIKTDYDMENRHKDKRFVFRNCKDMRTPDTRLILESYCTQGITESCWIVDANGETMVVFIKDGLWKPLFLSTTRGDPFNFARRPPPKKSESKRKDIKSPPTFLPNKL